MTTPHLKVILNPHLNKARKRWGNGSVPKSNHQNLNLSDFQFIAKKLCWPCHSVSTPSIFVRNPQCYHWYNYAANHQAGYRPWWWKDPRKSWPTWENVQLYTSLENQISLQHFQRKGMIWTSTSTLTSHMNHGYLQLESPSKRNKISKMDKETALQTALSNSFEKHQNPKLASQSFYPNTTGWDTWVMAKMRRRSVPELVSLPRLKNCGGVIAFWASTFSSWDSKLGRSGER